MGTYPKFQTKMIINLKIEARIMKRSLVRRKKERIWKKEHTEGEFPLPVYEPSQVLDQSQNYTCAGQTQDSIPKAHRIKQIGTTTHKRSTELIVRT